MANPLDLAFPDGAKANNDVKRYLAEAFVLTWLDANTIPTEDFSETPYKAILISDSIFEYDPDDTITAHDGITVLKSLDNRVYKLQDRFYLTARVLDKDLVAQPSSPSVGDTYILTDAPTGTDWNSQGQSIATYSQRGWNFKTAETGLIVFVEDESAFYHYSTGGSWTLGLGELGLADGSVKTRNLTKKFGYSVVAEQSDPPVSMPGAGIAYIVSLVGTATGAWTGHEGKIAESDGTNWVFFTPDSGDLVQDLDAGFSKIFKDSIWQRKDIVPVHIYRADYSETKSVTNSPSVYVDVLNIDWTGVAGQIVEIIIHRFYWDVASPTAVFRRVIKDSAAVGIDDQMTADEWEEAQNASIGTKELFFLRDEVLDDSEHTYKFQIKRVGTVSGDLSIYATVNIYEGSSVITDGIS